VGTFFLIPEKLSENALIHRFLEGQSRYLVSCFVVTCMIRAHDCGVSNNHAHGKYRKQRLLLLSTCHQLNLIGHSLQPVIFDFSQHALTQYMQARSCLYASTQLNPHYFDKKIFFSKKRSKAIHLHFYAKINGFSLVKKALRRPQNAPNCTIYFKIFRDGIPPDPPGLF